MMTQRTIGGMVLCAALGLGSAAQAVPFTTDLSINGSVEFDPSAISQVVGNASQGGSLLLTSGGVGSASAINGIVADAPNPQAGALTDFGDGVGALFNMTGAFDGNTAQSTMEAGYGISIDNTSLTNTYKVTFKATYENAVFAAGVFNNLPGVPDELEGAFLDGEMFLNDLNGPTELFFTDAISDVVFGNELRRVGTGNIGGFEVDAGMMFFDVIIDPSSTINLAGFQDLEGAAFLETANNYNGFLNVFIEIDDVMDITVRNPVPEPLTAALGLMGLGVLGAGLRRRIA